MQDSSQNIFDKIKKAILLQLSSSGQTELPFSILLRRVKLLGINCSEVEIEEAFDQLVGEKLIVELFEDGDTSVARYRILTKK